MAVDPFLLDYDADKLAAAAEFLANWLPFLTRGLGDGCAAALRRRVQSINPGRSAETLDPIWHSVPAPVVTGWDAPAEVIHAPLPTGWDAPPQVALQLVPVHTGYEPERPQTPPPPIPKPTGWVVDSEEGSVDSHPALDEGSAQSGWEDRNAKEEVHLSWADMAEQEEKMEGEEVRSRSPIWGTKKPELTREQRELIRFRNVQRKKDFVCLEKVRGRTVNVLEGLELHTGVFSAAEQKRIVDFVYQLQDKGRKNELGEYTYSKPRKWMRGKGRQTIQFGCCYNYAAKNGNPPGILKNVLSDRLPPLFKTMIKRMVRWRVLPPSLVPDSCIVNIYEPEDCIPPHIDSHDFVRPFCTVSFLSECNILFGSNLKIAGPGDFEGSFAIPLPLGSVLVLNGNSADVAKHCVPAVPTKRISITFRTMDERKRPLDFVPEPDLQNLLPLPYDSNEDVSMNNTGALGSQIQQNLTEIKHSMVDPLEHDCLQSQHPSYPPETSTCRSSHRDVDRVPPPSINNMDRGSGSAARWSKPLSFDRGLLGPGPGQVNTDMLVGRSLQEGIHDVRSARLDGSGEQRGWRCHLEQKQSMVSSNRNVQAEDAFLLDEGSSQGYNGRRPMIEQQQTVSRRDGSMLEQQQTLTKRDEPEQWRNVTMRDEPMLDQHGIPRTGVRPQDNGHRREWVHLSYQ